jgi:hypothetical protein
MLSSHRMIKLASNKFVFVGLSAFSCFVLETTNVISVKLGTEDYIKRFRVILVIVLSARCLHCTLSSKYIE